MSEAPSASERVVFRSVGGPVWMTVTSIVCALLIGDMLIRGTLEQAVLVSPWLLLLLWFVYLFLFAPRIVATPDGVAVHNVLRVTQLSWGAIESITARWQIEFRMKEPFGDKPVQAWGAPTQRPSRSPKKEHPSSGQIERLRAMLEEAPAQAATRAIRWDVPGLVAGAVIVIWLLASIAVSL